MRMILIQPLDVYVVGFRYMRHEIFYGTYMTCSYSIGTFVRGELLPREYFLMLFVLTLLKHIYAGVVITPMRRVFFTLLALDALIHAKHMFSFLMMSCKK